MKGLQQTTAISQFCQVSGGSTLPRREQHCSSATPVSDLRVAFGSEPTLRAEVLWVFHTVTRHQSYNANEEIGELFQTMFPDSEIAKSFRCGKDKTAYIARFGLADFIKRDLISKVTGPFVLMFEESLNRTSKKKQLDLHVRFWEGGQVQSRYLGSQFMGHATAEDLMKHVKVSKCFIIKNNYCHVYSFFFFSSLAEEWLGLPFFCIKWIIHFSYIYYLLNSMVSTFLNYNCANVRWLFCKK